MDRSSALKPASYNAMLKVIASKQAKGINAAGGVLTVEEMQLKDSE